MGSYISKLGYNTHEHPASLHPMDLCTRLVALEKELQISQAENAKKEAVIQYLLHSKASNPGLDAESEELQEEKSDLKKKIARLNEDSERVNDKLRKALDTIFVLSTPDVAAMVSQSISPSCGSRRKSPSVDLIDLLGSSEECASAVQTEEDITVLDGSYENEELEEEGVNEKTTPESSLLESYESHESLALESQGSRYIVHFAESDEDGKPNGSVNVVTQEICVPQGTSDPVTPLLEPSMNVMAFTESGNSSQEDSLSPSRPVSTSTSFSSSCKGTTPPSITGTDFPEEGFARLATLASKRDEDESLDMSIALIQKMAQALPIFDTNRQAEPSVSASTKQLLLPGKANASAIEPNWSISKTLCSCQERESAASIHRRIGEPDELRYPDLFKYGVHFSPSDSERDVYRTIVVSNLSPDISLGALLHHVRGGSVVDAKLLDTVRITGSKSALITFLHEYAAMAFEEYAEENRVMICGVAAQVRVVSTPTWPMRIPLRRAIFDHHHTRCLEVSNFPEQISSQRLRSDLTVCREVKSDGITCMKKRKDGILELQFSSVDGAGHAYGILSRFSTYKNCIPCFAPDPCARPWTTLEDQQMACTAEAEMATKPTTAPDAEPAAVDQSGRLTKVEWESDAGLYRGRGFATGS